MKKFMTIAAMFAAVMMSFSSCQEKPDTGKTPVDNTCPDCGEDPCVCDDYVSPVTIDGNFADWDALDASKVAVVNSQPEAVYTAITTAKVYADDVYINIYFEFDETALTDGGAAFDIYLNQDGDTGVGDDYYVGQTGVDYLLEDGEFMVGGVLNSFNPGLFVYGGSRETWEWGWSEVLPAGSGIASGAGNGNKYEMAVMIEMLQGVELSDTFSLGLMLTDINAAGDWSTVGCLPNANVTDENTNGKAAFLPVTIAR